MSIKFQRAVLNGIRVFSLPAYTALGRRLLERHVAGPYKHGAPRTVVMEDRNEGLFSIFFQVLGLADVCIARRYNFILDFRNGPYVRPDRGANWWAYYFEPTLFLLGPENANVVRVSNLQAQHRFSDYGRSLPPAYARALMRKMGLTVKADIRGKVAAFTEARFRGKPVVGIHYRGTDKVRGDGKRAESVRVPYAYVAEYLQRRYPSGLFFVATDEASFLAYLKERLPGRIVYNDAIRSVNGNAVHHGAGDGARDQAGEEALIDCLLLAQCRVLVRTASNLSLACGCFNPQLETIDITGLYRKGRDIPMNPPRAPATG